MIEINIISALSDNYIYLLRNTEKGITTVIDPGEADPVEKFLNEKGWHLNEIVNTHHHHDHTDGNAKLRKVYGSKLIAPIYEKERISNIDVFVSDNDIISVAGTKTKVIHTPGHTIGHVCFYMPDENALFSGDTLFYLGCGRVFEGSMEQMWLSLAKLKNLPDNTLTYCGHEYTTSNAKFSNHIDPRNELLKIALSEIKIKRANLEPTIPFNLGKEKKINPFLRVDDKVFTDSIGLKTTTFSDSFKEIRLQKDSF
jgi:hydroxyacylglutathione hydrolase